MAHQEKIVRPDQRSPIRGLVVFWQEHQRRSRIGFSTEGAAMNRKGIEFSLKQVEPDLWKWQFQIGDTVTNGQTRSRLIGIATHRAQKRIDLELRKLRGT